MAEGDNQPVIIRKKKKGHGGHGHHGGAWKVAYADFVTAMMAFFLLLWLLSSATDEQKKGIADYFSPVSVAREGQSGSGGILGGETITADGAMVSNRTPFGITMTLPADDFSTSERTDELEEGEEIPATDVYREGEEAPVDSEEGRLADVAPGDSERALADGNTPGRGAGEKDGKGRELSEAGLSEAELARLAEKQAEEDFTEAVERLREAVQSVPELAGLADNLLVDRTAEGMRLQIVDQQGTSMFQRGSSIPEEQTRQLFSLISQTLSQVPNQIAIKGHTDSVPYRGDGGYSNWELSSDRALASRRALIEAGLDPARIADVVGKADTDPLDRSDPTAPQNRRISIILLKQPAVAAAPRGLSPGTPEGAGPAPAAASRAEAAPAAPRPAPAPGTDGPDGAADGATEAQPTRPTPAPAVPTPEMPTVDGGGTPLRSEAIRPGSPGTSVAER